MGKKLLIISHNIIDNSNNIGKTIISLLNKWPKEDLYSLYFRNEKRASMLCDNSYMISDMDIINGLKYMSSKKCGKPIVADRGGKDELSDAAAYRMGNKRYPTVSLIRDLLWYTGIWKSRQFDKWIANINPDTILFVPNDYTLAFEVALYVKSITKAKFFTFFTDDAFYYKQQQVSFIDRIRRKWLVRIGKQIVDQSLGLITASYMMRDEYKILFGKDSIVLGNCVELSNKDEVLSYQSNNDTRTLSYIGNLHSNRWICLLDIAHALEEIELEHGINCIINVYTGSDLSDEILSKIKSCRLISFKGSIPSSEVRSAQEHSDILIHIESFDQKSKVSTRLSMSTKIFEYMARYVPIFAYGPSDISSMQFLASCPFASICTDKKSLKSTLCELLMSEINNNKIKNQAYLYAKENFLETVISEKCYDYLTKS